MDCRAPVETVTWDRRTITRRRYRSNTDPVAVTMSDFRCRPVVHCKDRTTTRGLYRPCRTLWKSNTYRCSARRRTCEWTSNSTGRSTVSYSLKVRISYMCLLYTLWVLVRSNFRVDSVSCMWVGGWSMLSVKNWWKGT